MSKKVKDIVEKKLCTCLKINNKYMYNIGYYIYMYIIITSKK